MAIPNFNPLFPYGKRQGFAGRADARLISIHSSHTGRDPGRRRCPGQSTISIHSSHTGRDRMALRQVIIGKNFNPLFPYGKRLAFQVASIVTQDFNPLFPYGKRLNPRSPPVTSQAFQSTLPIREETRLRLPKLARRSFQSTLPIREET